MIRVTATVFSYSNVLCCELRHLRTITNLFYRRHSFEKKSTKYRSADKSLARPGRKKATATEDFDFHITYL